MAPVTVRELTPVEAERPYRQLHRRIRRDFESFDSPDFFQRRLMRGNFELLSRRFDRRVYAAFEGKRPVALVTHFIARGSSAVPHSLGLIYVDPEIEPGALHDFQEFVLGRTSGMRPLAPFNGHFNLGCSIPESGTDPTKVSFLTAAAHPGARRFLVENGAFVPIKTLLAFKTSLTQEFGETLRRKLGQGLPAGYSARLVSLRSFKRDISIYHQLVNTAMRGHDNFDPLDFDEEWELMRSLRPLVNPRYFRFLFEGERPVALWFGMPNYNERFRPGQDLRNVARVLSVRNRPRSVRAVYAAVLPSHQGRGLLKYIRVPSILQMIADGVDHLESSYIDEENQASIANVLSTGGTVSHRFQVFTTN